LMRISTKNVTPPGVLRRTSADLAFTLEIDNRPDQGGQVAGGGGTPQNRSLIAATPQTIEASEGDIVSHVTVSVRDTAGTPLPGQAVQLVMSGVRNKITPPIAISNAAGSAVFDVSS